MTYWTTLATIKAHLLAGRLRTWTPVHPEPDFAAARWLLMAEEAWLHCPPLGESAGGKLSQRTLANTRAMLELFVGGELLVENVDLKRLMPASEEVWELRVTEHPQVRLFGWFPMRDVMVISHIENRAALGGRRKRSRNFAEEINKVARKRARHFPDLPALRAHDINDCISNGLIDDIDDA